MFWFLLTLFVVALGLAIARRHLSIRPLVNRPCAGTQWRRRFPHASPDEIRSFLTFFADAFAFPSRYKTHLRPSDQIMAIYRMRNPRWSMVDGLELETLGLEFEREYGLDIDTFWNDKMTLGDLFERTSSRRDDHLRG